MSAMPDAGTVVCDLAVMEPFAVLAGLLFLKHLAADGPLQSPYQVANKGKFLHPGGLLHAGIHAGLSGLCLFGWAAWVPVTVGSQVALAIGLLLLFEFSIHYATDFAKVRLENHRGWLLVERTGDGAVSFRITSPTYFISFLTDQTIHSLTYIAMIYGAGILLLGPVGMPDLCMVRPV